MKTTLAGLEIALDDTFVALLADLKGTWRLISKPKSITIIYSTQGGDTFMLGLPMTPRRTLSLNHLVWHQATGRWVNSSVEQVYHRNGDPLDFRFENLELRPVREKALRLRAVTPPAVPEKGISKLPNGQFKVRAYDPATKKPKYVGLRNTREEAVELKRAFLAGEVGFRTPVKVVQKPLIGPKPSSKKLDSDIFELPNGQFLVQVFDPTSKRIRYLGLPDTRKEAAKLKRAFLAASTIWDG